MDKIFKIFRLIILLIAFLIGKNNFVIAENELNKNQPEFKKVIEKFKKNTITFYQILNNEDSNSTQKISFGERSPDSKIKYIVNHYTADSDLSFETFYKSGFSAHYIIDTNGAIYQLVSDEKKAWHAGISSFDNDHGINEYSIGIEHVGLGFVLSKDYIDNDRKICIIFNKNNHDLIKECDKIIKKNENFKDKKTFKKIFLEKKNGIVSRDDVRFSYDNKNNDEIFFTDFPKKQINSSIILQKYLIDKYDIKPQNILSHSDIAIKYLRKKDPGPLFPYKKFAHNYNIGLFYPDDLMMNNQYKNLIKNNILNDLYENKKKWFIREMIKFGYHDPFLLYDTKKEKYFIDNNFNLDIDISRLDYEKLELYNEQIDNMIIVYNLRYRPDKKISNKIDDKDLYIIKYLISKKK
jgi:N-acetylmuramoyl-L-alanine amidase